MLVLMVEIADALCWQKASIAAYGPYEDPNDPGVSTVMKLINQEPAGMVRAWLVQVSPTPVV